MRRYGSILWAILTVGLLHATLPVMAEDDEIESGLLGAPVRTQSTVVRQETLELPGVTACHQCEWRPKPHTMAAADRCGTKPDGAPRAGIFECGFSPDCDRLCEFVRCAD